MVITATVLTEAASTANTPYATASISPTAGRVLLAFTQVGGIGTATASTVSGLSGTWTNVGGSNRFISRDIAAHWCSDYTGTGTLTIDNGDAGTSGLWCVIEIDGADTSNPVVAGSFQFVSAGSVNAVSITLNAAAGPDNRPFAAFGNDNNTSGQATPRANWTELSDRGIGAPTQVLETQWRSDAFDTAASVDWVAGPYTSGGIALEIAAAGAAGSTAAIVATLPALTGSLIGTADTQATVAAIIPALTSTLAGTASTDAVLASTFPALTATLTAATTTPTATLAATLPAVTGTLTAAATADAVLAGTLPAPVASLAAEATATAAVAAPLPALTGELTGVVEQAGAVLATALPELQATFAGAGQADGAIAAVLPALFSDLTASAVSAASLAATLPTVEAVLTGHVPIVAVLDANLPALVANVTTAEPGAILNLPLLITTVPDLAVTTDYDLATRTDLDTLGVVTDIPALALVTAADIATLVTAVPDVATTTAIPALDVTTALEGQVADLLSDLFEDVFS